MEFRIIDQSEEIVPGILQGRDPDLTTDIHRFLNFGRTTSYKILVGFFDILDSPKYGDIFSFWSLLSLEPELITTDIESDIVGLIEVGTCTECFRIPGFRSIEIIDLVDRGAQSEDGGSHSEKVKPLYSILSHEKTRGLHSSHLIDFSLLMICRQFSDWFSTLL